MFPYRNTLRYTAVIDKWSGYVVPVNGEPGVTKKRNVLPEDKLGFVMLPLLI